MRINTEVQTSGKLYLRTYSSILPDLMYGQPTWFVVGDKEMRPGNIDTEMDRPGRQGHWTSVRRQGSRSGVHAESGDAVMIAARSVAPSYINVATRRVRPGILHAVRKDHRAALDQRRALYVDVILRQFLTHGRIDHDFARRLRLCD